MNEIIKIISNEFRAIGTNIPILIVLILGNVGYGFLYNLLYNTNVYKEAPIAIVDMSQSDLSRHFVDYIDATQQVKVVSKTMNFDEAKRMLIEREIVGFLYIPSELKEEIMNHNGCMLMRGDSGDCVEVVTKTVFKLWDEFGGTINSKGYKVLDPHIKAIYGDSITIQRCEEIYKILEENGFACSNVVLGVGSFSFQCIEENGELKPFTRDTFSSCIKATYCEVNGNPIPIFKNPKDGGFKKSQKGCCVVFEENGMLKYVDGRTYEMAHIYADNLLQPIFKNGIMLKEQSLSEIRNVLHGGDF